MAVQPVSRPALHRPPLRFGQTPGAGLPVERSVVDMRRQRRSCALDRRRILLDPRRGCCHGSGRGKEQSQEHDACLLRLRADVDAPGRIRFPAEAQRRRESDFGANFALTASRVRTERPSNHTPSAPQRLCANIMARGRTSVAVDLGARRFNFPATSSQHETGCCVRGRSSSFTLSEKDRRKPAPCSASRLPVRARGLPVTLYTPPCYRGTGRVLSIPLIGNENLRRLGPENAPLPA